MITEESTEQHEPLTWEQIQEILNSRKRSGKPYTGHRTGNGRYTKPTMSKAERRKKHKQSRKRRKENR